MENQDTGNIELLRGFRARNKQAVKQIYQIIFNHCAGYILKNGGNMEDAEDVIQQCLIALFRSLYRENFSIQNGLKSYLCGMVRNIWLKQLREDKKKGLRLLIDHPDSNFELEDKQDELEEKKEREEQLQLLEKKLTELKEDCRNVLKLFFYEKKTSGEVAQIMGYSPKFVRNKKKNCIDNLKRQFIKPA